MKCKACGKELTVEKNLTVEVAGSDDTQLDVILSCNECGHTFNATISADDFFDAKKDAD